MRRPRPTPMPKAQSTKSKLRLARKLVLTCESPRRESRLVTLLRTCGLLFDLTTVFHDEIYFAQRLDVVQGILRHGDNVGRGPGSNVPALVSDPQQLGVRGNHGFQDVGRRNAG